MKILFFTNEYSHPKLPSSGGVGSFLKIMAHELSCLGHDIHILGFSKKNHAFHDNQVKITFFKKYKKRFPISEFLKSISSSLKIKNSELFFLNKERQYLTKQLKKYAKKHEIDIIESFVFGGYTSKWDNTIPLVLRYHGSRGFWHYYLGQKKEEHKIFMEQLALQNTPYTIAVSDFSAKAVKEIYNIDIDKVIHNGIDTELFTPNPKVSEIEQSIFYFGTISKAKGVDILCHVFNDIIENFPNSTLHLIGRGHEYLENIKQNVLSEKAKKHMTYYGVKQMNELPDLLSQATVCVFPSLNENFSLAIEEAMALQKPVIASNIPAFKEIIFNGENGFIAKSQADYLKYISLIFTNSEEKNRISKNAREHILNLFTKDIMVQKSIEYYEKILNS